MNKMSPEAASMAQVLLDHHGRVCQRPGGPPANVVACLITYKEMCERAGVPFLTRSAGHFLQQVAEWCDVNGWPPINSLAVNQETRMPGGGYDEAPGCSLVDWEAEVKACIAFTEYPNVVS
jgi:hypothetical protein